MTEAKVTIIRADYQHPQHREALIFLLDSYARDPMGGAAGLSATTKAQLPDALAQLPHAFSLLAYVDGKAAGLANCFVGFSTFACKPLINIHDFVVHNDYRGQGLSQKLLQHIANLAIEQGCCKITLEVLGNNAAAQAAYRKFGFANYSLSPEAGTAQFWQKWL